MNSSTVLYYIECSQPLYHSPPCFCMICFWECILTIILQSASVLVGIAWLVMKTLEYEWYVHCYKGL